MKKDDKKKADEVVRIEPESRRAGKGDVQKADKIKAGKGKHPGTKNLIPFNQRTEEEQRELAIMGGKASGEKRRKNKTFKEALQWYLDMEVQPKNKTEKALLEQFPGLTNRDYVAISAVEASQEKDVRAMVFARDTTGEIPKQTIGIEQEKPFEISIKTLE